MKPLLIGRWLSLSLSLSFLLAACGQDSVFGPVQSSTQLSQCLQDRWQRGDTLPLDPALLPLPSVDTLANFVRDSQWVRRFDQRPTPFIQGQVSYWQAPDTYLSLWVSDLATDTVQIHQLLRRWMPIDTSGWSRFGTQRPDFWRWRDTGGEATALDAVWHSRFLITLQTNHPEGKEVLLRVWRELDLRAHLRISKYHISRSKSCSMASL